MEPQANLGSLYFHMNFIWIYYIYIYIFKIVHNNAVLKLERKGGKKNVNLLFATWS